MNLTVTSKDLLLFLDAYVGMKVLVEDEDTVYLFNGARWVRV